MAAGLFVAGDGSVLLVSVGKTDKCEDEELLHFHEDSTSAN